MSIQMLTRRTTQRQHLMRPDILLVLKLLLLLHLLLTDVLGDQVQGFHRELFSLMSRSTNCYRGRRENLWSSDKPNCVCVAPTAVDVVDKAAYIIVNAVEAGLVSHAKQHGSQVHGSE